jgi:hypothetical protein
MVDVDGTQALGVYELASNLTVASSTAFTISQGATSLGNAYLNGANLIKNGVSYSLGMTGAAMNLTLTAAAGLMYKADAAKAADALSLNNKSNGAVLQADASAYSLTGTADSDIFCGRGGNDSISTGNGRDVAVYDTNDWGRDSIVSDGGSLTLLFSGLSATEITTVRSGADMIVSKAADSLQAITVENWNDSSHTIVYGETLSAFNVWLNAATPTAAQENAARNEVWQKTGLLA